MTSKNNDSQQKQYLFDNPKNVSRVIRLLVAICMLLFVLDFILHRHSSHPWEHIPGFYALYGFIGCVLLVIFAKWLRLVVKRPEFYYSKTTQNKKQYNGHEHKEGANDVAP